MVDVHLTRDGRAVDDLGTGTDVDKDLCQYIPLSAIRRNSDSPTQIRAEVVSPSGIERGLVRWGSQFVHSIAQMARSHQ